MTSLAFYERDRCLPASAGELGFVLPSDDELLARFAKPLRELLGEPASTVELEHARWKPGVGVSGSWRVTGASEVATHACWKRYAGDKARGRGERTSATPGFWALPDTHEVLFGPSADLPLPGLGRALEEQSKRRLARLMQDAWLVAPGALRKRASTLTVLRYKPERRAVCRVDASLRGDGPHHGALRIALRVLPPAVAARVTRARATLAECAYLAPQPTIRFSVPRIGWIAEDWLPGELDEARALTLGAAIGALLRELHDAPLPATPEQVALASEKPLDLGLFAVRAELAALAARVQSRLPTVPVARDLVWCHGDFHADQVLFDDDGPQRLLDFDALGVGPRETDLASWVADLLAADPSCNFRGAASGLLTGYGRVPLAQLRGPVARRLCHMAAATLRRLELDAANKATFLLQRALELTES